MRLQGRCRYEDTRFREGAYDWMEEKITGVKVTKGLAGEHTACILFMGAD